MKHIAMITAFVTTLTFAAAARAAAEVAHADVLRTQLAEFIETKKLPGMVVMVKHKGKAVFHQAVGYADVEKKVPLKKDHRFKWYSMSKPVTSIAFLQAMQDKGLSMDDALLQDLYPSFKHHEPIPLKHIATHTAGFPYGGDWKSIAGWKYWWHAPLDDSQNLSQMMNTLADLPLMNTPGTQWQYSMSQDIQGAIIEQLSGQPLDRFMQEKLFQPLGMNDTGFLQKGQSIDHLAPMHAYDRDDKASYVSEDPDQWDKQVLAGGSGLYGTAEDYMKFLDLVVTPQHFPHVLDAAQVNAAKQNQLPGNIAHIPEGIYPNTGYGYGFGIKLTDEAHLNKGSYYWAGKAGTTFWVDPKEELAVVVMIQLEQARSSIERYLVPMVYEWIEGAR